MRIEREEQVMASLERSREQLRRLSVYQNEVPERLYPLGGRVAFVDRPGQGTSVTIHLPLPKKGDSP